MMKMKMMMMMRMMRMMMPKKKRDLIRRLLARKLPKKCK